MPGISILDINVDGGNASSLDAVVSGESKIINGVVYNADGSISDSLGNLRGLPVTSRTAYQLANSDSGTIVSATGTITVNGAIISPGFAVSVYNDTAGTITITQGAGVTMYITGTSTTGNRTLDQRTIASIICVAANTFVISGGGVY